MAALPLSSTSAGHVFRPTDEELVDFYLRNKINGNEDAVNGIREVDLCNPWDLPEDRLIEAVRGKTVIGAKKTLVFYTGHAPKGLRTNWVIHEYRATSKELDVTEPGQRSFVLCKLFKKFEKKLHSMQYENTERLFFEELDWRRPDPHREKDLSPTFKMLSTNGQMVNDMGCQNLEPNELLPDSFEDLNFGIRESSFRKGHMNTCSQTEKMVAVLVASGASAGEVTDPNSLDPTGKMPASIAATSGHEGLAGSLSEVELTSHLTSLKLKEEELSDSSAELEAEIAVNCISQSQRSFIANEDQNSARAAVRIQAAFRAHSFRGRQEKEVASDADASVDEYNFHPNDIQGISVASKLAVRNTCDYNAALSIQKKFRGWKGHKDFLAFRKEVVKIQAHVRGHQVRKQYKVICWAVGILEKAVLRWRRKRVGLRGYRHESVPINESEDEDIIKVFRQQKVEGAIDEAFSRVLSMVDSPNARQQYSRVLERYQQAKFVDCLPSSCGDERITVPTTNHRDPRTTLLTLVNMDTDSHTACPQPIALQDGGETVQLVSPEQKSLMDFDATNNNADQSAVLLSSEKKSTIEAYKGRWESLIQRTEKDMGEGLNKECLTNCALSLDDSTEQNSVDSRQGRGRLHSMEHDQPAMFANLGTDLENEGIVSDLLGFVREKEFYKSVGKAWKRGYLLYDPPRTDRSSLMAYMANCLEFEIYNLDLTGLSSIEELTNVLVSTRNRSLIAIKDFDQWIEMLPNLKIELTLSGLLKILSGLLSSCGNEWIIVFTINHNHMDRVDAALLRPLNIDLYIHSSSHLPSALRNDGGEIVQFDSSEQQSSVDFDAINNKAYQRDVCMSNSVEKNTIEASRRQCMHESVLSLVDSTISLSSTDSAAPDNSAHHVRAYQSGRILFNSEKNDTEEGLNRECLTKSALNLDDSSKQKSLMDVDATENKAYQSFPVVSLSDNKNRGQALKRECITKIIRGLEDLQHHSGGRPDDSANSFGAIYDPGIHTTRSLAQNSFKVLEALPTQKQPNDCVPLLSLGRLELEGCVQEEKSQDLPRHILVLNPLEQSTKNVAHVARADQWSPTLPLPEKKMVRTWKRKYRIMRAIFEIHQQHFGRRCEGAVKSFRATRICRKSGINRASRVKRIHKRRGIHQWSFHQKWATRKGYSSGDEKPFEISSLSMDEKLDSWLLFIKMSKFARSSPQTLALPDRGEIVGPKASPSSEFAGTNDRPHHVRQDQSGSTASHHERKNTRETSDRQGIIMSSCSVEDLQQHFGCKHKDAVKRLDVSISMFKSTFRQHRGYWWPCRIEKNEARRIDTFSSSEQEAFDQSGPTVSNLEKENSREALKRECKTKNVLSLEDRQHQYGGRHKNAGKGLGNSLARKPFEECQESRSTKLNSLSQKSFEVLHVLPLWEQSNNIRHLVQWRRLVLKRWVILKKSQDLPRTLQIMNCSGSLTAQSASSFHWPISLPDGGRIVPLLEKKIMRKPFKRKYSTISVSFEDHHQHFSSRCGCAANSHGAKRICEQRGFTLVFTAKRIRRQYGIHRCTFRQGYSFGGEGPAGVLSPSMEERVISRFQFLHISWLARSSPHPLALRSGRKISGHIAFLSSEFPATNNGAPPGRQGQCGSSASRPEKERVRETTNREGTASHTINREVLEQHFGKKREDVAKILGISVSTLKRIRKKHGISKWPYWRRNKGNSSPSSQRVPPWPDWRSNHVFIPPDPNGEKNPSPTVNTLSPNGHIRREKEMGGPNSEPNEYLPASFEDPNFQNTGNGSIAEFENPSSIHDSHNVHCSYADFHSSAVNNENEAAGGSGYFWGQVSELSNFTFPVHSDSAAPIQPVPTIPHTMAHPHIESTQILRENMGSFEDRTNLLAPQMEPLPEGHVFGSVICTIGSVSDLAPSQPMPTIPHTMESSEYWRDMLALVEGHLMEKNHYGSFNLMEPSCSNLAPSEPMPTIPHTTTLPTERQDLKFVKLDATYGEDPINLYLPLMPGIMELKQAVSKQLGLGLDSFKVTYENERGKRILMTHDEDVRELLRLASSENQDRNRLVVIKVPNITDFCGNCECDKCISLKGKKP